MSTIVKETGNILFTGGRAPATLELVRIFHRKGFKVFIAESFKSHICRFSSCVHKSFTLPYPNKNTEKYIGELIKIINTEHIDILIPTCEEIFYIAKWKYKIEQSCKVRVFTDDFDKLINLHNKYSFIKKAELYGLKVPGTRLVTSIKELDLYLREEYFDHVLKPVYSRFGSEVRIIPKGFSPRDEITISPEKPWVLQQFISGRQYCTYSIASNGKQIVNTTYNAGYTINGGASINFVRVINEKIT
ncbi:MAG TPA: hypothetical protein VF941_00825, partial [Clostridia bacterium]